MTGHPIAKALAIVASAALLVTALAVPATAADKADCKKGGWKDLVTADRDTFKNQGQCIAYVVQGGTAAPDTCTELNKPQYDGTYHTKTVMLNSVGDERITLHGAWSATCTAGDYIAMGYLWTGGWASSVVIDCVLASNETYRETPAEAGVGELMWEAGGDLGDPVWTVSCTHEW